MSAVCKSVTVSEILRSDNDDEPKKKSREDWRKAKELEEARKAGTAPAAVDEEGKDINPHIPQYISASPWYYGSQGPTLKHQRIQPNNVPKYSGINEWYKRGVNTESVAKKFRPGACENCGAMGHKKNDCFERPRKIGAKFNDSEIAPDEFVQPLINQSYDGKRDRWAGYDPSQHKRIVEQYQRVEEAKRQLRADKLDKTLNSEEGDNEVEEDDEDKYVDEVDMPGTKVDSKQRITVRNLRIREDTAKYLRNLDINSAYYDPKTRSMRDNPHKGKDPEEVDYAGENFIRFSGDTRKHASAQLFAWEAYEKGVSVHLLAEPTKLEKLKHEYEEKKDEFKKCVEGEILQKYGGEEHLKVPPKELLLAQTEEYREYSRSGKVIKGEEKGTVRSKYEEDVYVQNHTSVFGSYWRSGRWGYRCCHSFVKNSYCTGEAGKAAAAVLISSEPVKKDEQNEDCNIKKGKFNSKSPSSVSSVKRSSSISSSSLSSSSSSSSSSSDSGSESDSESNSGSESDSSTSTLSSKGSKSKVKHRKTNKTSNIKKKMDNKNDDKLKQAIKKQEQNEKFAEEFLDERKRPYNSMYDVKKPTDEEMEAYYMKRKRDMDPMADFLK